MTVTSIARGRRWSVARIRHWPLWSLSPMARAYVIVTVLTAVIATVVAVWHTTWHLSQIPVYVVLLACAVAMVEATRDVKLARDTLTRDLQEVWYISIAVLLPPVFALLAPILPTLMKQFRVRRNLLHRRAFSVASNGLANAAASWEFHSGLQPLLNGHVPPGKHVVGWFFAVLGAAISGWLINHWQIVGAVRLTSPTARIRALILNREAVTTDAVVTCLASLVAFALTFTLAALIVALPVVLMQKRFLMHSQLVAEARTDAKTGLLNAATWHREASTELSRIRGYWSPTSLAIIDIDHFKLVNDTHGHLAGDRVLRVISDRFKTELREGDLIGRFGGEEFAILLPHTSGTEAGRVAERLRGHIADEPIVVSDGREAAVGCTVTISVGVAELAHTRQDLDELLAVADAALYQAKAEGRDRICIMAPGLDQPQLPVPPGTGPAARASQ
ncbi:MAG TPA: GGDEF domain-containing protein [Streptosporangiaceae bacterium]|nr:GGDEF domain-containing protein [Streptosporangiaceae bacterium]